LKIRSGRQRRPSGSSVASRPVVNVNEATLSDDKRRGDNTRHC